MRYSNALTLFALALFGLIWPSQTALAEWATPDERVEVPDGGMRALSARDFGPHANLRGQYSEAWTYVFLLDGGMQAHFSLSRANLGRILGRVSGAEFALTGFDGRSHRAPKQYSADDFTYTASQNRIAVSPRIFVEGSLAGTHRVYFNASKNDVVYTLDVELTDIAPGLTWGDGVFHLGNEEIGVFVHIPQARVRGTITVDGVTKTVSGTAYMDHTFQTDFAPKLVQRAFRLVEHGPSPSVGFYLVPSTKYEQRIIGVGAVKRGGRYHLQTPAALDVVSTRPKHGAEIPRQFVLQFDGDRRTIFNRDRDAQDFAVMEDLGSVAKTFARGYLGGEPVVVRGRGVTNAGRPFAYDLLVVR